MNDNRTIKTDQSKGMSVTWRKITNKQHWHCSKANKQ